MQDRLVKALRLERISSLAAANAYLPRFVARYNARFARTPLEAGDAHRPLPIAAEQLRWICCAQFERTLSRSLSCQFRGQLYVVDTAGAPAYHLRGARITICDPGTHQPLVLLYLGKPLPYRSFPRVSLPPPRVADDKTLDQMVDAARSRQRRASRHKPPPNHPWLAPFRPSRPNTTPTPPPSHRP